MPMKRSDQSLERIFQHLQARLSGVSLAPSGICCVRRIETSEYDAITVQNRKSHNGQCMKAGQRKR